ncbi:AAEL011101-PA [Aedes aegypti]|uniref:U4/U6.U5 small nuclear ribonucleoprotein 27 kDa protein n=2 Tax=Aedes aegypti TaxID=7159 RepID=A0A1S4FSB3_AEDAE|nr:U4/U6.U5 small nuclear ribonucleoprotein 27 kDa protein [Aedes aegypti]EAT36843.1 AAEL011101-PA [Aedes aegypti]
MPSPPRRKAHREKRRDRERNRSAGRERRRSIERERSRDRSRERRERDRERDLRQREYRRRSRSRSYDRERGREKSPLPSSSRRVHAKPVVTQADLEGKTPEEQEMLKTMGFCGFDTTKGKKVEGNNVGEVHVILKRKYRQYMNRKGGFNRPLDFVA